MAAPTETKSPPSYRDANNRWQRARAAGLVPDHWYAVEPSSAVKVEKPVEVNTAWGLSVALYRSSDGALHAIENRCAHRQLKLSTGTVVGDQIACPYHGWTFGGDGHLKTIPHELFGSVLPKCRVRTYPVQEKYGLVWIYFGDDVSRAAECPLPPLGDITGWPTFICDFSWHAHHSIIAEGIGDYTHWWLHRQNKPFIPFGEASNLTHLDATDQEVTVVYSNTFVGGDYAKWFMRSDAGDTKAELKFVYPYHSTCTGHGHMWAWYFLLPVSDKLTRVFLMCYVSPEVTSLPTMLLRPLFEQVTKAIVKYNGDQDGWAVAEEQTAYDRHYGSPQVELNPAVKAFRTLMIQRWDTYLEGLGITRNRSIEDEAAAADVTSSPSL